MGQVTIRADDGRIQALADRRRAQGDWLRLVMTALRIPRSPQHDDATETAKPILPSQKARADRDSEAVWRRLDTGECRVAHHAAGYQSTTGRGLVLWGLRECNLSLGSCRDQGNDLRASRLSRVRWHRTPNSVIMWCQPTPPTAKTSSCVRLAP